MTLRQLADMAYMIRVEWIMARSMVEYQIAATLIAAGREGVEPSTPEAERKAFDESLVRPLDHERMRAAILREVTG